jgi:hypothetical protein
MKDKVREEPRGGLHSRTTAAAAWPEGREGLVSCFPYEPLESRLNHGHLLLQ